jgi:hypothetical protein
MATKTSASTGPIPILVEGILFGANILKRITLSLLDRRAYVNESIAGAQLSMGICAVFIDGLSEIPTTNDEDSTSDDFTTEELSQFIREHADTHFFITSRKAIPEKVSRALKSFTQISLLDLDELTEKPFVTKYLQRSDDADEVIELVKQNCSQVPRIPLMLRLLAETYNATGTVPRDRGTLFASYLLQILRPESTGMKSVVGVQYALRELVRGTYLSCRGERRGFFEEDGIKTLSSFLNPAHSDL